VVYGCRTTQNYVSNKTAISAYVVLSSKDVSKLRKRLNLTLVMIRWNINSSVGKYQTRMFTPATALHRSSPDWMDLMHFLRLEIVLVT
jgi:hypothetical protein